MSDKEKYSVYYKNNKFQQIKGFCNVVIFDGTSNAAKQMGLSQSAVSHQIGSLEEDLKLKLFTRVGNKMVLTEDGQRFYDYVIPTLKQMDNIYEEFLIENDKTKENELKIAGYHSAISCILPKYVELLLNKHSKINLEIENINKIDGLQKLKERKVDLAFFAINDVSNDLVVLKTFKFIPTLLVSNKSKLAKRRDKITPENIASENIILIDNFKILPTYTELFKKYHIKSRIKFTNADWEMIRFFTKRNIGASFSMNYDVRQTNLEGMVDIDISHLFPIIEYQLISRTNILKESVRKFIDIINSITDNDFIIE